MYAVVVLCGAVLFTFVGCVGNDFVDWDDISFVVKNRHIESVSLTSLAWMATTTYQGVWHPLTWLSHALDRSLWGLEPYGHHLINVIIHVANVGILCFLVLRLLEIRDSTEPHARGLTMSAKHVAAFTAALLFGLHPLRVESVAWVSERKDVLCALFYLCGLWAYLSYATASDRAARSKQYVLSLVWCILALLSKPMAVTFPIVLLLLDYYPLRRLSVSSLGARIYEKTPFLILVLAVAAINVVAKEGNQVPFAYVPVDMRIMNALYSIVFYIRQSIYPGDLIPLYQLDRSADYFGPPYLLAATVVLGITVLCVWRAAKDDRLWPTAWFSYLITLFPTLGFYMSFRHSMADRYTYLPTMSLWILVGLGAARVWDWAGGSRRTSLVRGMLLGTIAFVSVAFAYASHNQIAVWRNSETLWTHVMNRSETVPALAYFGLGKALQRRGELDEALRYLEAAAALNPKNNQYLSQIATVFTQKKQYSKSLAIYREVAAREPENPKAHVQLGYVLGLKRRYDEAEKHFQKALSLDPDHELAHLMLLMVYLEQQEKQKALRIYRICRSKGWTVSPDVVSMLRSVDPDLDENASKRKKQ